MTDQEILEKYGLKSAGRVSRYVKIICEAHGVEKRHVLKSPGKKLTRKHREVACRHAIMSALNDELGMSVGSIGRALGGFDHTSVLYGLKRHKERQQKESGLSK